MDIKTLNISDLKPYEKNPRKNDEAVKYVAESIKQFGFKVPIVIDKDHVIVAGHTRWKAAKKLGISEVPCIVADDLTEEQIKAFRLADNKVAEKAEWDLDLLSFELDDLIDFDMSVFGFEDVIEEEEPEVVEDDFDAELPEEPYVQQGDLYLLGDHRLLCGDSTKIDDVEKLMGGKLADLLITDPPYNVNYEGSAGKIENDNMDNGEFYQFLYDFYVCASTVMKPGASFYVWHADVEGLNFRLALKDAGFQIRQTLIWNKNAITLGRQDYQWKHEPCLYGWKDGAAHNWYGDRKQSTVIDMHKPSKSELHPTMKPVELFDYQIKNSSKKGDCVLDLFGGSGTTVIACEQNERKAFLMEYDPRYAQTIIERWEQFTGKKAVKL